MAKKMNLKKYTQGDVPESIAKTEATQKNTKGSTNSKSKGNPINVKVGKGKETTPQNTAKGMKDTVGITDTNKTNKGINVLPPVNEIRIKKGSIVYNKK